MQRLFASLPASILILSLAACHPHGNNNGGSDDSASAKPPALPLFKRNPETREHPDPKPVATYKVRTDNKLNELYFSVSLYETSKTMYYQIKMDYEGLTGEDTVRLPDLGTPPHPVLEKGKEKYSCILGLLDNDKKFRELKMVYVTNNLQSLKITTLKHYMVTENYHLVSQ